MSDGIQIDSLGGNCPVQAEGTFDGVPFYFRARGCSVTCDVGDDDWCWTGPEYEHPLAGWISQETALAFIGEAYAAWKNRNSKSWCQLQRRRSNGLMEEAMQAFGLAHKAKLACNQAAEKWLTDYASVLFQQHSDKLRRDQ